ncbi:D-glucuronyl C5-epimerase family protein [Bosea sp. (in: a-proteobacteria)]|jgi:hypothetical protein|uniref:D-glucuronyl C5-epimerase family protein n=1 Tax=Bosea sp. (in: a-proteobacteria) TaxID=1871050 RepID=UPI0012255D67|nr:D-glucuronyl C5-epimerase family protein [Bosea sp. (in: a-proteobacteria)]TAJ32728.1 MAG: hypothetical protein EPO59_06265 [Bosea sp. (in: a-proteobacteria)]
MVTLAFAMMACKGPDEQPKASAAPPTAFDYALNVVGPLPLTSIVFTTPKGHKPMLAKPTEWWLSEKVLDPNENVFRIGNRELRNAASWGFGGLPDRVDNFSRRVTSERCVQNAPASASQRKAWTKLSELAVSGSNLPGVTWFNNYASNANDQIMLAPWPSAFAQALNLQALLTGYCLDKTPAMLELALKAGDNLIAPIEEGGLANPLDDGGVWFEELPGAKGLMPFILNGHLYAMNTLYLLADMSGQAKYRGAAEAGRKALDRLLLQFDLGYWTRYDLRPRYFDKYFEVKIPDGTDVSRVRFTWNGGGGADSTFSVCASGCDQTIGMARNNDSLRISAFLEGARFYNPGDSLRVSISYVGEREPELYAAGFRPDRSEGYRTSLNKAGDGRLEADLGVRDSGWHAPDVAYMEYHAVLMADLYAWTRQPTYYVTAVRWRNYLQDWKEDEAVPYRKRRFGLTASPEQDAGIHECLKSHHPLATPLNVINDALRTCAGGNAVLLGRIGLDG